MKVSDLARELRCTISDVQRAARSLGIAAKSPAYELKATDCVFLREKIAVDRTERARALSRLSVDLDRASAGDADEADAEDDASSDTPIEGDGAAKKGRGEAAMPPAIELRRATVRDMPAAVRDESSVEILLHEDFFFWLTAATTEPRLLRRANLVLRQFLGRGRPSNVKTVAGPGAGWLRTRLGGNGGNQFYLWWTKPGAPPVAGMPLAANQILIRGVRHHDETDTALEAGKQIDWVALRATELSAEPERYGYAFKDEQRAIAASPSAIRLIKGHPGTGKTTTLQLAASYAEGTRALYVTYSRGLAVETEQHFRAFGPKGMSIDVLTFEELLTEFDRGQARGTVVSPDGARLLPPDEAARRMEMRLGAYQQRWLPWEDHGPELYGELHAHFVGRALPISFRRLPASPLPILGTSAYLLARRDVIGEVAAKTAAAVGEFLWEAKILDELMPGPLRARDALDELLAGKPVPPRLRDLDWIFIDEVQDLTLVEAMLLVELAARLGRERGLLPGFVAAGDEGQTVRPTDFEWGPLADLLNARLGARSEHELAGNVRSPRNIATVVNRSWRLYRQLDKSERPRGYAEAEVEETAVGRIIYTRALTDAQLGTLFDAFARTPGSALIYPGYRVPDVYSRLGQSHGVDVWSSDSAKGLDFQVVGILDAGKQLKLLADQAAEAESEGRLSALWARTLADQMRVALSRSTDTLVLVERGDDTKTWRRLYDLCDDQEGFLGEMEPEDLAALLAREDADSQALVVGYLAEIPKLLQDRPARALKQARYASGLLGALKTPGAVRDPALRKEVWRMRGVAALLAAMDTTTVEAKEGAGFREANTWLRKADLPDASHAALQLRNLRDQLREGGRSAHDDALTLALKLESLQAEVPELEATLRRGIVEWCRGVARAVPPPTPAGRRKLEEAVTQLAKLLGHRHPELTEHRESVRRLVARAFLEAGDPEEALNYYGMLETRDFSAEAECHEQRYRYAKAAELYERSGDLAAALRCARRIPDIELALRLARVANPAVASTLEWVNRLRADAAAEPGMQAPLTSEERHLLLAEIDGRVVEMGGEAGELERIFAPTLAETTARATGRSRKRERRD